MQQQIMSTSKLAVKKFMLQRHEYGVIGYVRNVREASSLATTPSERKWRYSGRSLHFTKISSNINYGRPYWFSNFF